MPPRWTSTWQASRDYSEWRACEAIGRVARAVVRLSAYRLHSHKSPNGKCFRQKCERVVRGIERNEPFDLPLSSTSSSPAFFFLFPPSSAFPSRSLSLLLFLLPPSCPSINVSYASSTFFPSAATIGRRSASGNYRAPLPYRRGYFSRRVTDALWNLFICWLVAEQRGITEESFYVEPASAAQHSVSPRLYGGLM